MNASNDPRLRNMGAPNVLDWTISPYFFCLVELAVSPGFTPRLSLSEPIMERGPRRIRRVAEDYASAFIERRHPTGGMQMQRLCRRGLRLGLR